MTTHRPTDDATPDAVEAHRLTIRHGPRPRRRVPPWRRRSRNAPTRDAPHARADHAPDPPEPPVRGILEVDLRVRPGEVVGVLGPNGAGKSTLLRLLATALRPDSGTLRLLGDDARRPSSALRRRIGYADDAPAHFDALSGYENARFFARAAGVDPAAAATAANTLLDRLGLRPDADRRAGEYSHGMRRKLSLAAALAHDPALVILDEPTLGLDPPSTDSLHALIRERAAAGAAIIIATHRVADAARLCHRIVLLHHGTKVLEGTPHDLIRRIDGRTRIEVRLRAAPPHRLTLPGADLHATHDRIIVRSRDGAALLPRLCAALIDHGAEIRAIRIREPDLRNVFAHATGAAWAPDPEDATP